MTALFWWVSFEQNSNSSPAFTQRRWRSKDVVSELIRSSSAESSEEVFKLLVEGIKDYAIFMLDTNGIIVSWNPGAERIKGYKADEIIGKHFSTFYRREDIERGHPVYELEVAKRVGKYEEEGLRLRKDGSEFAASVLITALYDSNRKLKGFSKLTRDISERQRFDALKAAADAIENERQNLRNLFQHTPEMVCILRGPDHVFEFVNEAHVKVIGADLTGKGVRVAQPESVEVHVILDSVYRDAKTIEVREAPITVRGSVRYFNLTFSARRNVDGSVGGVMILGAEVTDAVFTREGTALLNEALQLALTNAPLADVLRLLTQMVERQTGGTLIASILLASEDGSKLLHGAAPSLPSEYNDLIHGIAIGQAVGSCGTAAFRKEPVSVDDIQKSPLWADYKQAAAEHGLAACWSIPILRQDGKLLGTIALYSPVARALTERESDILRAAAQTTALIIERQLEVSERKESEVKLKIALSAGKMGTWHIDLKSNEVIMSDELKELFGVDRFEKNIYDIISARMHPDDVVDVTETYEAAIKTKQPYSHEYRIVIPGTGEIKWLLSQGRARYDKDGSPLDLSGIAIDVTERRQAQELLMQAKDEADKAREEAERANELKSAFLANMSHEIRTPLGAMMGFADLLKDPGVTPSERQSFANILSRNGESLSVIINDILDLSKVEAGHLTLEYTDTYPDQIAADVVSLLRVKAKEKDLVLEYVHDESSPQSVVADPTRVRQILLNIVGNAVKFTQFGSVSVRSFGCLSERGRPSLCFEVSDTGIGIAKDQHEHVFEMFVQADGSMTRRFGGTGLGLALSRSLARAMGGDIKLTRSEENAGSTFVVTIEDQPEMRNETTARPSSKSATQLLDLPEKALTGVRVLVVDDAPDNQQLIWRYLNKQGALVTSAEDGLAGYRAALSGNFDLVLMDIQMPVMDGYSATQKLREAGYRKPIIALTAHAMSEVRKKALNVGYTDHLTKPINQLEMIRTIAKYINRSL